MRIQCVYQLGNQANQNRINKMKISKTTEKFANKRKMDVYLNEENSVYISAYSEEHGIDASSVEYEAHEDGSFTFVALFERHIEDLPYYVRDEKHLREVVSYIATQTKLHW